MKKSDLNPYSSWIRLEQPRLGSRVVFATDDFFAAKERMIEPQAPVFIADRYDDHGKWMDGWESRRKRGPGHDFAIVRLGVPGIVRGLDIDTSFFTGNFPPAASVDACVSNDEIPDGAALWRELLPRTDLAGDRHHFLAVNDLGPVTHLRLNIFPDGGIARIRIYGEIRRTAADFDDGTHDFAAIENGGRALACSDEHYGSMHNVGLPGASVNMGDGWETARRRGPGNDWLVLALGVEAIIESIEIDTAHFKGNYPDRASLRIARPGEGVDWTDPAVIWAALLPESRLQADHLHRFECAPASAVPATHVRLDIFPDGGVARLRVYGRAVRGGAGA